MIPLIQNIAFTEVDSAGNLNDKAGTSKIKLPVQYFKLTDNISGNLALTNNSAHKKIILETNGKTIINTTGSPLTTDSSINLELRGTGNIQSQLKTFTSSVTDTANLGTTTISEANNSTVVVSTDSTVTQHSTVSSISGGSIFNGVPDRFGTGGNAQGNGREFAVTINGVTYSTFTSAFRQVMVDSTRSGGAWNGATVTVTGLSGGTKNATFNSDGVADTTTGSNGPNGNLARGDIKVTIGYNDSIGWMTGTFVSSFEGNNSEVATFSALPTTGNTLSNFQIGQTDPDRLIVFSNALSVPVVLTGADPFDNVTVASSATTSVERTDSTDGSFSLTGTISGTDGSGKPFALVSVNTGTGAFSTTGYTGTLSTKAF